MNKGLNNITEMFLSIVTVQVFVVIASSLSSIVNGLVIGNNLSKTALAALGLVIPMITFLTAVAQIVSGGAGILCGNYMGRGEKEKINEVYSTSIIILVFVSIIFTVLGILFANPLAHLFGANAETLADTASYIRAMSIGILPTLLLPCVFVFLQMCNKSVVSLILTIVLAVFNALLCLIDVHLLNGGIFGVGVATSISKYLTLLIAFIYVNRHKDLIEFKPSLFNRNMAIEILKVGSPSSLAGILYSIRNIFINNYAGVVGGTLAVNSLAILSSCGGFLDAFNIGVGSTLTMLASVFIGEKDGNSLKKLIKTTIIIGMIFAGAKLAVVYLFGKPIALAFGASGELVDSTVKLLRLYTWSAPPNIVTLVLIGIYQTLKKITYCNIVYVFNAIITPLVCCTVLSKIFGIDAIYRLYYLAELVSITGMYVVACIRNKKLVTSVDELMYLDKDLATADKYSLTVRSIDGVVNVSEEIENFLKRQGIDKRRSMMAGLCMEEMVGNVVEHGFIKDNKENSVDVFAYVENDEVSLRLRDNCVPFDPNTRKDIYDPEDPCKNVGIRMVSKIAKEMNYNSTFGMNVLTIKL